MNDWTAGYVTDIDYTFGYYPELNPLRVKLAFINKGLVFPEVGAACELGFGQGLSTNLHAAASVCEWHGTDFNPAQVGFARQLAKESGNGANLYDETFAEFAARTDLPDFDYIGLHGIWSWISDENRAVIVDFLRRKLKVGGVLYISYNTMPGWAAFAAVRHLIKEYSEVMGPKGRSIVDRIGDAIDFAVRLQASNPAFSAINPDVAERIKKLLEQNKHYLAHEYFNKDWQPMHFDSMARWLESAKLSYACPAGYLDHLDAINLTLQQQEFLQQIPDPTFRESVKDFMVNQQFRRDYWVKGARKLNVMEQLEALRAISVLLVTHRSDISLKVTGALGEATMSETVYAPILDVLADYKVRDIASLEIATAGKGIKLSQIMEAMILLVGAGHVAVAQGAEVTSRVKANTDRMNLLVLQRARCSADIAFLASPVTGGGVAVGRFSQLFLVTLLQGRKQPEEWALTAHQLLREHGQKLIKEGKTLETDEENLAELKMQAQAFAEKQLPILKALQVVDFEI